MADFTFLISRADEAPITRERALADEHDMLIYARQLQADWPESETIDVLQDGCLLLRLRRSAD